MSADVALDTARERADHIRSGLASIAATYQDIGEQVAIAYHERDWGTLGYESWDAYVEGEFAGHLPKLNRDERRQFVGELRDAGLSTRAIASVAGVHKDTVRNDLEAGGEISPPAQGNDQSPAVTGAPDVPGVAYEQRGQFADSDTRATPAPAPTIRGADGKHYPSSRSTPIRPSPSGQSRSEYLHQGTLSGTVVDPADMQRDAELAAEMEETAARFRRNFSAAIARADDVWQFDPERIAQVYAADYDQALRPFLHEMARWCERVDQASRRLRSGLRVVGGSGS